MLIIVPCSSRKRVSTDHGLNATNIQAIDLNEYSEKWVATVRSAEKKFMAKSVYMGVGFVASESAASCLNAQLQFLSAGMSLISPEALIPGYNLTISDRGPTPFSQVKETGTCVDWWNALNKAFGYGLPLLRVIREHDGPVYIALPAKYLEMVEQELTLAVRECPNKVRIITSAKAEINSVLNNAAIRYDQRLNTRKEGPSGANASFTQRALLSFARIVSAHSAQLDTVKTQQILVDKSFENVSNIERVKREKVTESQLLTIIESALSKGKVSRGKLLETLRQSQGIACEVNRFSRVYEQAVKLRA